MSWTATNSHKCCATCANWGGQRELKTGGSSVQTNSPGDRGKCYANVFCSVTQGPTAMQGGNSCSKYTKWPALK